MQVWCADADNRGSLRAYWCSVPRLTASVAHGRAGLTQVLNAYASEVGALSNLLCLVLVRMAYAKALRAEGKRSRL